MIVSHENARQLCRTVFAETMRAPAPAADVAVDVLVAANLRGIDSHGISVLPYYLDKWRCGQIVPDAEPAVVSETPTTVVFDGQQAIGHYASLQAMDAAISRAREHGLGAAVVRQSTHNGAISHYTIHAARNGMIGIAATACAPHVAPFGGTSGLHGTNPISYAFPRGESDPLVFDLSTGHSSGKLKEAAQRDGRLPENTALNSAGQTTTDPGELKNGWIMPVAGHIGFGLALLVDGLTAALADSPIGRQIPLVSDTSGPYHGSFFALAMSPESFGGAAAFEARINDLVEQIESHEPQDPDRPVRWPGQRGWQVRAQRLRDGIPVHDDQWNGLLDELKEFDVDVDPYRRDTRPHYS